MSDLLTRRAGRLAGAAVRPLDVLVVGGGINGVGAALDAASRGLRTVVVEQDDLGVGTSSRSSKLIHGGLRYLEQLRLGLVREALAERRLLISLAPHLVRLERFVVPILGSAWEVPYVGAGLALYDGLGGRRGGRFRYLSAAAARHEVPALGAAGLRAGFEYSDGVFDDARYLVAVAKTAERMGATILTRVEVTGWMRSGKRVVGAEVRDRVDGEGHALRAAAVIDTTGAFKVDREPGSILPSRGAHLVIPRHRIDADLGLTIRVPGRVVFLIPWFRHWLLGTTDVPHTGTVDRPVATPEEIDYLLDAANGVLDVGLSRRDVVATFAGIRPLIAQQAANTASASREERIDEPEEGLVRVRGGKYTTYRRVAARLVDRAGSHLGSVPASATGRIPLAGAVPFPALQSIASGLVDQRFEPEVAHHLVSRYGGEARRLAELARVEGLDTPLVAGTPYLAAEAWWAVHREYALSFDDVLARRTRLVLEDPTHGEPATAVVGEVLADALGWEPARIAQEAEQFSTQSATEYGVALASSPTVGAQR